MPYDEQLARRVRPLMALRRGFSEKKIFGGVAYFLDGNLCIGVSKDSLIVRVGLDAYERSLEQPHVSTFEPVKRPMRGWVMVGPEGLDEMASIREWVDRGVEFVETLPPKE